MARKELALTYFNQFHKILGFFKANNVEVYFCEGDWLGSRH